MIRLRDVLNTLQKLPDNELDMEAKVGTPNGIFSIRQLGHIRDANNVDDLCGDTFIFDTDPMVEIWSSKYYNVQRKTAKS